MAIQTPEIIPTQEELREIAMVKKHGRRVHENSPHRTTKPERQPHTPDEQASFDKIRLRGGLWEKKKPEKGDEEFIWKVVSFTSEFLGADDDQIRVQFSIQKCWRNRFVTVRQLIEVSGSEPDHGDPEKVNEPFKRFKPIKNARGKEIGIGELRDTGERMMDASDFVDEFKRIADKDE